VGADEHGFPTRQSSCPDTSRVQIGFEPSHRELEAPPFPSRRDRDVYSRTPPHAASAPAPCAAARNNARRRVEGVPLRPSGAGGPSGGPRAINISSRRDSSSQRRVGVSPACRGQAPLERPLLPTCPLKADKMPAVHRAPLSQVWAEWGHSPRRPSPARAKRRRLSAGTGRPTTGHDVPTAASRRIGAGTGDFERPLRLHPAAPLSAPGTHSISQ
jgi:hypothetical protein